MRITVVGAVLIIAGAIVVVLVAHLLAEKKDRGPEHHRPDWGGERQ